MAAVRCMANEVLVGAPWHTTKLTDNILRKWTLTKSNGGTSTERVFVFSSFAGRTSSFAIKFVLLQNGQKITSIHIINSKMTSRERSQVATTKRLSAVPLPFISWPFPCHPSHVSYGVVHEISWCACACPAIGTGYSEANITIETANQPIIVYARFGGKFDVMAINI